MSAARPWNQHTMAELTRLLAPLGISDGVAARLYARVHARGAGETLALSSVPGLTRQARAALGSDGAHCNRLAVEARWRSPADRFVKYLFRLADGARIEAVRIPLPAGPDTTADHYVVCASSQAGCALRCAFCATGAAGFRRNLAAWEIVEQIARIRDEADAPVRGVVFMGMGEPFLNYDQVLGAADILAEPAGLAISRKAITLSTVGVIPAIRRFTAERRKHRLAVSLHSAIPEKRRWLVPLEAHYPLDELLAALGAYCETSGERVVIEYVMIAGVNIGREDAEALVSRLAGLRVRLSLIDVNDTTGRFAPPTADELARFRDWLAPLGQPVVRRYSGGRDIAAACGMLAARENEG